MLMLATFLYVQCEVKRIINVHNANVDYCTSDLLHVVTNFTNTRIRLLMLAALNVKFYKN